MVSLSLVGLLLTGLVVSGLVVAFPPAVRAVLVLLLTTYISGDVLRARITGAATWSGMPRAALSVLLGLSLWSVVTWCCTMAGMSFTSYLVCLQLLLVVFFVAALIHDVARGRTRHAHGAARRALGDAPWVVSIVAVAAASFFVVKAPALGYGGDGYDHIGYIRAIGTENALLPSGVLAPRTGPDAPRLAGDPRKGMMHPLLAAVGNLASVDPAQVWRWLPVILAPAAVLAFWAFAAAILPGAGYAAFAFLLFLLFQGGLAREFLSTLAYGQHLAMMYYWILVVQVTAYGRSAVRGGLIVLCVLVLGGTLVHIDVAIHFVLLVAALVLFRRTFALGAREVATVSLAGLVCVLGPMAWKLAVTYRPANLVHMHPQGLLYLSEATSWFVPSPIELLKKYGLLYLVGLAMVPVLPFIRTHRKHAFMCFALALPAVVIAFNPFLAPLIYDRAAYLLHRFVLNVPAFATTALVLGSLIAWARRGRLYHKIVAVMALTVWLKLALVALAAWTADARTFSAGDARMNERSAAFVEYVARTLPAGAVLLSDPATSYFVSAYSDARVVTVVHQHGTPSDPDAFDRAAGVRTVLSPYTSQLEALGVFARYRVDYVLLNSSPESRTRGFLCDWEPSAVTAIESKLQLGLRGLKRVYDAGGYTLYQIPPSPVERPEWAPTIPFFDRPDGPIERCRERDSVSPPRVTVLGLAPQTALPGETITIVVGYRRDMEPLSPLPLRLRIRLDQKAYFDATMTYPTDKLVRRARERSRGVLYRTRIERTPFDGFFTPEMWPLGVEVFDTFEVKLPSALAEGDYDVSISLVHEPLIPNFTIRDLVYNADSYAGESCASFSIRRFVTR